MQHITVGVRPVFCCLVIFEYVNNVGLVSRSYFHEFTQIASMAVIKLVN